MYIVVYKNSRNPHLVSIQCHEEGDCLFNKHADDIYGYEQHCCAWGIVHKIREEMCEDRYSTREHMLKLIRKYTELYPDIGFRIYPRDICWPE